MLLSLQMKIPEKKERSFRQNDTSFRWHKRRPIMIPLNFGSRSSSRFTILFICLKLIFFFILFYFKENDIFTKRLLMKMLPLQLIVNGSSLTAIASEGCSIIRGRCCAKFHLKELKTKIVLNFYYKQEQCALWCGHINGWKISFLYYWI